MRISLIAAMADNRCIGRAGKIPWRFSGDLKRFKRITIGHPVIMGRKTFDSLGKPLPGRKNIVMSRLHRPEGLVAEVIWVGTLADALDEASASSSTSGASEVFVLGGAEIYTLALPHAQRIYLTQLHTTIEGDAFFPEFSLDHWRKVQDEPAQTEDGVAAAFRIYERAI